MSISSTTSRVAYVGNGAVDTYAYTFKVFEESDLRVTVRDTDDVETLLTLATDYTVTGVGESAGGNVVLVNAAQDWLDVDGDLLSGYTLTIRRVLELKQETDIRNAGDFYPETHEDQFDRQVMIAQQQQDEIDRSVKLPESVPASSFDPTLPGDILDSANKAPVMNASGTGFASASDWPSVGDITGAASSAASAAASASAADASADAAALSEAAASASAASAAAQLASAFFRDVVYITSADSPVTITNSDNGKLFNINSSGGSVAFTLPAIAGLALPFNIAFKLTTAGNSVTVSRASTDTIEGATSASLSVAGQGLSLIADADGSPDNWSAINVPGTVLPIVNGGTGQATKAAAFDALSPMTTGGDLLYGGASGTGTRLPNGNLGDVLMSSGGTAPPVWTSLLSIPLVPTVQSFLSSSGTYYNNYYFFISSGSATAGATYTNNSITFTVHATVTSATRVVMKGSGAPSSSGTLTKTSGTGDSTLTFSMARAPSYTIVEVLGSGGSSQGSGTGGGAGTAGSASTFGSFINAGGGNAGAVASPGGTGGTASVTVGSTGAVVLVALNGNGGEGSSGSGSEPAGANGHCGGSGPFGGAANSNNFSTAFDAQANSGSGGAGAGIGVVGSVATASGGGAGAYCKVIVPVAAAHGAAWSVGGAKAGGTAGANGYASGASGSGVIIVTEFYQ